MFIGEGKDQRRINIKTLIDGNVKIRRLKDDDIELLYKMINDKAIQEYVVGDSKEVTREDHQTWFTKHKNDVGRFMITYNDNSVGAISLTNIDYKNFVATINIKLASSDVKNKGIGLKAVNLILKYAFKDLAMNCIEAKILDYNKPSIRLFEKCGFMYEGTLRQRIYKNNNIYDLKVFSILRDEFDKIE